MVILGMVLAFLAIMVFELPGLIKKKMWREMAVFFLFLFPGIYLSFATVLDWPVPDITGYLDKVFVPVHHWVFKLLE